MSRKFISGILAASIAISTLSAVPARADERDAMRAVAGITALFILGKAIENSRRDRETVTRQTGPSREEVLRRQREEERARAREREREEERARRERERGYGHGGAYYGGRHDDRPHKIIPRPLPPVVMGNLLPRECRVSLPTNRGTLNGFGARCLERNFRHASRLPQTCITRVERSRGPDRLIYGERCLNARGYRIARR